MDLISARSWLLLFGSAMAVSAAETSVDVCPVFPLNFFSLTYFSLSLSLLQEYMDANKCIDELLKQLEEERRCVRR